MVVVKRVSILVLFSAVDDAEAGRVSGIGIQSLSQSVS